MFATFYDYFLYTKSWAYIMMLIALPTYVWYWNCVLNEKKTKDFIRDFFKYDAKH